MLQKLGILAGDETAVQTSIHTTRTGDRPMEHLYARIASPHGTSGAVTLDAAARELGLSPSHLSRRFKQASGVSFRALALRTRQLRAADLLRTTRLSVKEIAAESGYRHVSDFSASFRRIHGVSPTEYRALTQHCAEGEVGSVDPHNK